MCDLTFNIIITKYKPLHVLAVLMMQVLPLQKLTSPPEISQVLFHAVYLCPALNNRHMNK